VVKYFNIEQYYSMHKPKTCTELTICIFFTF
jgi:hypothetical protein